MTQLDLRGSRLDIDGTDGDRHVITLPFADSDGDPLDLSGYTFKAEVLRRGSVIATYGTLSTAVSGDDNEILTITLSAANAAGIGEDERLSWRLVDDDTDETWIAGRFRLWEPGTARARSSTSATVQVANSDGASVTISSVVPLATLDGRYVSQDATGTITAMTKLTQAEYDALGTPEASTFYVIVG